MKCHEMSWNFSPLRRLLGPHWGPWSVRGMSPIWSKIGQDAHCQDYLFCRNLPYLFICWVWLVWFWSFYSQLPRWHSAEGLVAFDAATAFGRTFWTHFGHWVWLKMIYCTPKKNKEDRFEIVQYYEDEWRWAVCMGCRGNASLVLGDLSWSFDSLSWLSRSIHRLWSVSIV